MSKKIYVMMDHGDGAVRTASWEALVMAQKIAGELDGSVHAVLLGHGVEETAQQIAASRLASVIYCDDAKLASYDPDCFAAALRQLIEADTPQLMLLAHIYQNIDLAPKLSAALTRGLLTDCIDFRVEGGKLTLVRQMFRNKINADVRLGESYPWIVTMQSGAFSKDDLQSGGGNIEQRQVDLSGVTARRRELEAIQGMKGTVDLTKADVIVGVGRGIKKAENLELIRKLAEVLGAEIGASRPVVDNEWLERERQIGSSGQNVTPRLYIACGISGAIQHIVGMKGANCIVAINTDPNAPIFNIANYGIVGDLFEIVPILTRQLQAEKDA